MRWVAVLVAVFVCAVSMPRADADGSFTPPVDGAIVDHFRPPATAYGPGNRGVDYQTDVGDPVRAAADGEVVYAGWRDGGWGNEVTIAHGHGVRAMYAHLSAVGVAVGDHVDAGETIGLVGATGDATGPHLHFELRLRGAAIDPLTALPPPVGEVAGGGAHDTTS
jgi:murein DD-endopeptidase MepM/ murein hydrolase activator NlpD